MIGRSYESVIKRELKEFPVLALLGPRQVGKSTLAKKISDALKKKVVFLDLERQSDRNKITDPETFFHTHQDNLVIIDEVQIMPELFALLRPAVDENRKPGRFFLLGSASPHLVKGVSESLAGRVRYLELPPVTAREAFDNDINLNTLWVRGGFPASLNSRNDETSFRWRYELVTSFIERDLPQLFGVTLSSSTMRNFWQMLAHQHGSLFNAHTLALSLGVSGPTVKRYLNFLEGAYMVRILEPWFVNISKRLVKSPKVYLRDSGLLHALLSIETHIDLLGHPVAGFSWEGFVLEQIIQQLPANVRAFFYRTHQGAEADIVLVKGIKPIIAIEIKLTNAPVVSRGFYQSLEDMNIKKAFVVTPSSDTYKLKEVTVTNLAEFVTKFLPEAIR